ncbi:single-stranded DNA-binding protein [Ureaplasma miroungigenitalium]|uniref:Single-stranded DNA-binding protein n=1 Tax=Ureaplasma miroungigenitalium TaxID=1042321 RepID=A0ABT3BMI4_9BACT|nr:single-stranded DNA-binding protein [Ureaplasma miroungigenitalium]MCV3728446.1 single-stranded DNA-binding protein [Ureaplasma miroungigenitalium]MCV3734233.1 single-stranded DNA-binding protein [Ureaplasma miroungigenitalium]
MNKVFLFGNLARDPLPLKETSSSNAYTRITVAVSNRSTANPNTDFISCTAWNKTAEFITSYLHKGDSVIVEGSLVTSNYVNKNGERVYDLSVRVDRLQSVRKANNNQPSPSFNNHSINDVSMSEPMGNQNSTFSVSELDQEDDFFDWINQEK